MNNNKNSIAHEIVETCIKNPNDLFKKNNGITIICEDFIEYGNTYKLVRASVINGQQTVRAILSGINFMSNDAKLYVPIRVIKIGGVMHEKKEKIIGYAKSNNTQYGIKTADLYANEEEQKHIVDTSKMLPESIRFNYINKRVFNNKLHSSKYGNLRGIPSVTKEEVAVYINCFILLNPNDRTEDLFKTSYDRLFKETTVQSIALLIQLRKYIALKHETSDINTPSKKLWSDMYYVKFKKQRVINYCLYILGIFVQEFFEHRTEERRRHLLDEIYMKMCISKDFNIDKYFNDDFWNLYHKVCQRFINSLYNDSMISIDFIRKNLEDITRIREVYNSTLFDEAMIKKVEPKILV